MNTIADLSRPQSRRRVRDGDRATLEGDAQKLVIGESPSWSLHITSYLVILQRIAMYLLRQGVLCVEDALGIASMGYQV